MGLNRGVDPKEVLIPRWREVLIVNSEEFQNLEISYDDKEENQR